MRTHFRLILLIAFVLTGCSLPASTLTVEPPPTSAPSPSSTPPIVSPPAAIPPADFSPLLYGGEVFQSTSFLLLGGVDGEKWYTPDESIARDSGGATYSLHDMEHAGKYFLWGDVPEYSVTCRTYFVGTETDLNEGGLVGTLDGWMVTKRDVTELQAEGGFYRQFLIDWLTAEGVSAPQIGSVQVFRVDIEGDGVDEVFIGANHFAEETGHMTEAGDYSLVLMRRVTGDDVATISILQDIYTSQEPELTFPFTHSISNFIDLNQDGILELVVGINRWEGFGAAVYQVDGQQVDQVLSQVCAL